MIIPFLDLDQHHQSIRSEIALAIDEVMAKNAFAGGPFVENFEKEFSEYCGCSYAVGVGSGTDALWIALISLGIGVGDEVITVANSFIATAEAISFCGAKPVFVDIDENTSTIDPENFEKAITPRTKAVIPVHIFGKMADMDAVMDIARSNRLYVIEDSCQAHGAKYKGKRAGTIGDAGCFSFYPGKNLGAFGEAGAVITDDPLLAEKMRVFRDHGQIRKYQHTMIGWNARMDGLQGAVLSVKLKYLDHWNQKRRNNAIIYDDYLCKMDCIHTPPKSKNGDHVYHIYSVRVPRRNDVLNSLSDVGIFCGIHYPVPIHLTDAYKGLEQKRGSLPVTERHAEELISLPMYPDLTETKIEFVTKELKRACV